MSVEFKKFSNRFFWIQKISRVDDRHKRKRWKFRKIRYLYFSKFGSWPHGWSNHYVWRFRNAGRERLSDRIILTSTVDCEYFRLVSHDNWTFNFVMEIHVTNFQNSFSESGNPGISDGEVRHSKVSSQISQIYVRILRWKQLLESFSLGCESEIIWRHKLFPKLHPHNSKKWF